MKTAYLYTGDKRYGRIGAILVDRVADVYPEMTTASCYDKFFNSDSTQPKGKMVGSIWQHGLSRSFSQGYDAFYDMYDDPYCGSILVRQSGEISVGCRKNHG